MSPYYTLEQQRAHRLVHKAKQAGQLVPLTSCELCGNSAQKIRAHHWRGYGYPLDVWWICCRCNALIKEHDGSLTKEQAARRLSFVRNRASANIDRIDVSTGAYDDILDVITQALSVADVVDAYAVACNAMDARGSVLWDVAPIKKRRVLVRAALRILRQ